MQDGAPGIVQVCVCVAASWSGHVCIMQGDESRKLSLCNGPSFLWACLLSTPVYLGLGSSFLLKVCLLITLFSPCPFLLLVGLSSFSTIQSLVLPSSYGFIFCLHYLVLGPSFLQAYLLSTVFRLARIV